jgi:hypothetical protein
METAQYKVGGVFTFSQIRNGEVIDTWESYNIVVNQGLNYILDSALSAGSVITSWYIGLFKNNYTPLTTDVASTFTGVGVANESTSDYSEATRPVWSEAGASSQSITNTASPANFTFTAGSPVTIYGAFLSSSSTKGGTTGTLLAASKFSSSKTLSASDILVVSYTISASST